MKVEAWILDKGPTDKENPVAGQLRLGEFELPPLEPEEILVEPIYGCWEGNMGHAIDRNPLDICRARGEESVVIGNAGVVRALSSFGHIKEGDCYVLFSGITKDLGPVEYPIKAFAYDGRKTTGLLAKKTKVHYRQLLPIPQDNKKDLRFWAAFSLRYITAWGNWRIARDTFRSMSPQEDHPLPYVVAWGGGVSLAILQLAKLQGFKTVMIASQKERLDLIESMGIGSIDRSKFPHLDSRHKGQLYAESEKLFLQEINQATQNEKASIFVDFIGEPVLKSTLKALAHPAVITTAGWKAGMNVNLNRAIECMHWHAHVHTHYSNLRGAYEAMNYATLYDWFAPAETVKKVYSWDNIPQLVDDFRNGRTSYFPLYQINPE